MLLIFGLIEKNIISIVISDVLDYENCQNPYSERQAFVNAILKKAHVNQTLNDNVFKRAQNIENLGVKGIDALHLACAEKLKVDYFVTCDDRIIKKYTGKIDVINPVALTLKLLQEEK